MSQQIIDNVTALVKENAALKQQLGETKYLAEHYKARKEHYKALATAPKTAPVPAITNDRQAVKALRDTLRLFRDFKNFGSGTKFVLAQQAQAAKVMADTLVFQTRGNAVRTLRDALRPFRDFRVNGLGSGGSHLIDSQRANVTTAMRQTIHAQ